MANASTPNNASIANLRTASSWEVGSSGELGITGRLEVKSGATADIESGAQLDIGGQVTVESGATMTFASGSQLTFADGFKMNLPVVTETTGASMSAYGVSLVDAGATPKKKVFALDAPTTGAVKHIMCLAANATGEIHVSATAAGAHFGDTGSKKYEFLHFNAADEAVTLIGLSSAEWGIFSNVNSVSQTTSST